MIATAPMAGPAQWRVPPSTLISTTVSGTVIVKTSPTVTYERKSAWMPPASPASAHEMPKATSL